MLKIKECKALARRTLAGKYKTIIGAYFINLAISCVMWILTVICAVYALFAAGLFGGGAFSFVKVTAGVMAAVAMTAASLFVGMWFDIGTTKLMLNICRGRKYKVSDVFYGFRSGSNTIRYILTGFLIWLITFGINVAARILTGISELILGGDTTAGISAALILTTAFILVTIYAVTCLMLAKIIIADKPETGIGQALAKSRQLMHGRMLKGAWLIYLSFIFWNILTVVCSISALWIIPYMTCTTIIFYMDADGTLWQLPDPERDRQHSGYAANAASDETSNSAYSADSGSNADDLNASAAATEPAGAADDSVQDGASNGSKDSSSEAADDMRDSWEKTISEMHIELPDGFNKTDI